MPKGLGKLETQLLALGQMRQQPTVESEDVQRSLGLTNTQTRELFSRLARKKLIARVRRGLYLLPPRLPPGGRWSPSEFEALTALMADCGGRYQICGPTAFTRYGWEDQVPARLYAYNNRISGERRIGSVLLSLIKVADNRLGGTETIRTPEGVEVVYSSRARSLVDAMCDWSRFGTLPRAFDWIRQDLARGKVTASALVDAALKYGNISTTRRLGKLLELAGARGALLKSLAGQLPETLATIPWCPTKPKRGRVDRKWGIVFNE